MLVRCRGGLVVLVRWRGGSGLGGALPRLTLGDGLRKGLDRAAGGLVGWVLGPWPSLDATFCVRASEGQGCCVCHGIASPTQKRSTSNAQMKNRGCLLGWGGQRFSLLVERSTRRKHRCHAWPARRWICNRTSAPAVADPPMARANTDSCVLCEPQPENPSRRRCQPPGRGPFGAQDELKPHQRSPTRTRSRPDAAAGRARSHADAAAGRAAQPHVETVSDPTA